VPRAIALIAVPLLSAPAFADGLTGKVVNAITQKPASGDEVILFSLSADSMKETLRTRTDGSGRFSLLLASSQGAYLVRVIHQGVTYDHTLQSGAKTVAVEVYDVTSKLEDVNAIMDVQRFEATSDRLEIKQLITMRNTSRPPRTLMNDRPFEIRLPPEAEVKYGLVQVEDAKPIRTKPAADGKGEYYFRYPLRPGDTRFGIVYQLPYHGWAALEPQIRNPGERFLIMLPKSMTFQPKVEGIFQPRTDVSPDNVQGTAPITLGQTLAFRISGTGMLVELQRDREQSLNSEPPGRSGHMVSPPKPSKSARLPFRTSQKNDSFVLVGITVALAIGTAAFYWKKKSTAWTARKTNTRHSERLQRRSALQRTRFRLG
jgi:5-hydroxyisourate hydrolase-like protein (transthyretin family)